MKGKYDNGDDTWLGKTGKTGEWCVAYHGVSKKKSYNNNYGNNQIFKNDDDLNHPGEKVGIGIYFTNKIEIAEMYCGLVKEYKIIFMCRVNPKKMRIPSSYTDYWVADKNNFRPYRILIKKYN